MQEKKNNTTPIYALTSNGFAGPSLASVTYPQATADPSVPLELAKQLEALDRHIDENLAVFDEAVAQNTVRLIGRRSL